MRRRKLARKRRHTGATADEWAWLTASPDANPFLGGLPQPRQDRLAALWAEHEEEIREMWKDDPPEEFPIGHPEWSRRVEIESESITGEEKHGHD